MYKEPIIGICKNCGTEFFKKHSKHYFCCVDCKRKYQKENNKGFIATCSNCGQEYNRKSKVKGKNNFCSLDCEKEFKHNESHVTKTCEICNKEFEVRKQRSSQRFCSHECQSIWQKSQTGELNSHYKKIEVECGNCKKKIMVSPSRIKNTNNIFCDPKCRKEWFSNVWSQQEEWKEKSRIRGATTTKNSKKTATKPQILIESILDKKEIIYESEYNCKYYSIDDAIFIDDKIYFIEIMGGYWHCDSRLYDTPKYDNQKERIKKDKAKNTYINNQYNIKILYLWEQDILNNIELCEKLIDFYISNNLKSYHSSSYILKDGKLIETNIKQFMEL